MQLNEFLSSLIGSFRQGEMKEWLKSYIFSSFDVTDLDEIKAKREVLVAELETVKTNLADYGQLTEEQKVLLFNENQEKGTLKLTEYLEFKEALLASISDIKNVISEASEKATELTLSEFFKQILEALDEAEKNNNDIEITKDRLLDLQNGTVEDTISNTLSILKANIQGRELNIEKLDQLIERLEATLVEIDAYL